MDPASFIFHGILGLFIASDCFSLYICVKADPGELGADSQQTEAVSVSKIRISS